MSTAPSPRRSDPTFYDHTPTAAGDYDDRLAERRTSAGAAAVGLPPVAVVFAALFPALALTLALAALFGVGFLARRRTE
jgi:hypothetical protein